MTRRFRSGFTGGLQYQFSRNEGTTQGSNEAATASNTFDYNTEFGANPTDIRTRSTARCLSAARSRARWTGGWRVGGIVNARSGVPINVTINRPDTVSLNGVTVTNVPGGNTRGTQRPDLVPGVDPYLKDGVRWLNPAAFAAPLPGTFGNLPRNYLRGPNFWQLDLMTSKDFRFSRRTRAAVPASSSSTSPTGSTTRIRPRCCRPARSGSRSPTPCRHLRLHARPAQPHRRPRRRRGRPRCRFGILF